MDLSTLITVKLKGSPGAADLSDFALVVDALKNSLQNVARCVTGNEGIAFEVKLSQNGNVEVSVTPSDVSVRTEIVSVYNDTIRCLQNGRGLDGRIDSAAICAFDGFSSIARRPGSMLLIGDTPVTPSFADRISEILEVDLTSFGSVTGRLERRSIHDGEKFTLVPPIAGGTVDCIFQHASRADLLRVIDETVTVFGKMHFAKDRAFPIRCEVETFSVSPKRKEFPTLLDASGWLRIKSDSVMAVREMRNAW